MRNACFRVTTLALMTAGALSLSSRASAQTLQTLVDFTSTWKYDASGTESTGWRTNTFNDASWPSGQGLLGLEPDNPGNYPAPFNTPLTVPTPITHYFRIHFNFSGSPAGATLIASNVVDDGCVIYLNGLEAARIRVPANQNSTTSASGGPATEGTIEPTTFPAGLLRQGDNVLAVEVHQSGTGSSDVAWGTKLVASVSTMLSITAQPQSQTVPVGGMANFSVTVSGGPVAYIWQKETSPGSGTYSTISGQTSSTYTINNVQTANAGNYRVIVSNAVNSVTSQVAALTVVSDVTPPMMLSAIVRETITGVGTNLSTNFNQIDITWDEPLAMATVTDSNNFSIRRFENNTVIPLQRPPQYNFPIVRLTIDTNAAASTWLYRSNYYICITNVADSRGNVVLPGTCIGVSWRIPITFTRMSEKWSYYDLAFFNGTNIYSNNNWAQTNYVESSANGWALASSSINAGGIYWRDPNNQAETCLGDSLNQQISFQEDPTLFRHTFVASNLTSVSLKLRYMIDDGAVFYLNGQEIHRYNMPAGPVNYGTKAVSRILNPTCNTNVSPIDVTLFPNTNWLAVAVYQAANDGGSGNGADTIFGMQLDADSLLTSPAPPPPSPPPTLYFSRNGNNLVLTWTNAVGFVLESSTTFGVNTLVNWTAVPNATSPYSTPVGSPPRFYRLRK